MKTDNIVIEELTEEKIIFEIEDNPKIFLSIEKYWHKFKIKEIDKKRLFLLVNF